ncbi:MAG: hypothetical protein ABQ298_01825 [Puniceicoccaceae bacterium]
MMNNRKPIAVAIGLLVAVAAQAVTPSAPVVTQVVKHVVPYDTIVWSGDSTQIIAMIGVKETGLVQELGVESTTGMILPRSQFTTVRKLALEPFLFEGKEVAVASSKARGSNES